MQNLKIRVNSEAESKEAQELFLKLGYKDRKNWTQRNPIHESIQAWKDGEFTFSLNHNEVPVLFEEITLAELRAMVNPMKEYLDKKPDGSYELIVSNGGCADRDWIAIPELSQFAVLNGDDEISFYDGNGLEKSHFISGAIIWQRDPDEPFLTPECTLNDQYAEIEQVRQVEIHGTVKAEPDLNFGAAQASGGVDATLAERQTQYGCYEDVAHVTQQILSALRIGNYDELPAPMKESLHMIASKMARIVNGDPEYLDNWHDIGGYAKLIEKLIKGE